MDGVDAALVEIRGGTNGPTCTLRAAKTFPYPSRLRDRLLEAARGEKSTAAELAELSARVGKCFADAANAIMRGSRGADVIASHGQTIAHRPGLRTLTVQIGEPAVIAERTGLTTIADFRLADVAAGGQGAPLVPVVHHALFTSRQVRRAIVNIGGIANATILPAQATLDEITASDCGPGNVLIDECVSILSKGKHRMDRGGRLAAKGRIDEGLLRRVLSAPFFRRRLPASTGREDFGRRLAAELCEDARCRGIDARAVVASATLATVRAIVRSCRKLSGAEGFDELYVCGGGARNPTLLAMLDAELPGVRVATTSELGVDPAFLEAQAFAILGWLTLVGKPGNIPAATGAAGPRVLGKIVPGRNYRGVIVGTS